MSIEFTSNSKFLFSLEYLEIFVIQEIIRTNSRGFPQIMQKPILADECLIHDVARLLLSNERAREGLMESGIQYGILSNILKFVQSRSYSIIIHFNC